MIFIFLVYLILAQQFEHIGLLASLQNRGLLESKDYFVVGIDLEQYDSRQPDKYLKGVLQDNQEKSIVEAFNSYIAVVPSASIGFENFASQVRFFIFNLWLASYIHCGFGCLSYNSKKGHTFIFLN